MGCMPQEPFRQEIRKRLFAIEHPPQTVAPTVNGNPNRLPEYPSPDSEKDGTTSLPLLCFGHGIQTDEGSLQWATDLRKVRPHCFSE
jgi:hypothetical protein